MPLNFDSHLTGLEPVTAGTIAANGPPVTAHEWMRETRSTLAPLAVKPDAHGEMPTRLAQPVAPGAGP